MRVQTKDAIGATKSPLTGRQRQILRALWPQARLSRRQLHRLLDVHPTLIGRDVEGLIQDGFISEQQALRRGRGRPQVPLTIDPYRLSVTGLSIVPGHIETARLNLTGERAEALEDRSFPAAESPLPDAARALGRACDGTTAAVGIATTGLVSADRSSLLVSSSTPRAGKASSLAPVLRAAGKRPVALANDMHALAARWSLTSADGGGGSRDTLLVLLEDGRIGCALLIDGRPNAGVLIGGNELGHTRFPIDTDRCYCGQTGCLERIVSSAYWQRTSPRASKAGAKAGDLPPLSDAFCPPGRGSRRGNDNGDSTNDRQSVLSLLSLALSNAVNFVRPHNVVLTGSLVERIDCFEQLADSTRKLTLPGLVEQVKIERWAPRSAGRGEGAAWLALRDLLEGPTVRIAD